MSQFSSHSLDPVKFLTMSANLLHINFFGNSRPEAKRLFAGIYKGEQLPMSRITMEDETHLDIWLRMDSSECNGKLSFSHFRDQLQVLLTRIKERLEKGEDPNLFTSDQSEEQIFHIPALTSDGENVNVLVLGFEPGEPGSMVLKLVYLDPEQFRVEQPGEGAE